MSERLKFEGRLSVKEKELKFQKISIESNRDSLREALDPFEGLADLAGERISTLAVNLAAQLIEYRRLNAEIRAIKKALGKS